MKTRHALITTLLSASLLATGAAHARGEIVGAVVGGTTGAVIGNVLGGHDGAVIGGALGAVAGISLANDNYYYRNYPSYQGQERYAPQVAYSQPAVVSYIPVTYGPPQPSWNYVPYGYRRDYGSRYGHYRDHDKRWDHNDRWDRDDHHYWHHH